MILIYNPSGSSTFEEIRSTDKILGNHWGRRGTETGHSVSNKCIVKFKIEQEKIPVEFLKLFNWNYFICVTANRTLTQKSTGNHLNMHSLASDEGPKDVSQVLGSKSKAYRPAHPHLLT